eukprot:TRINITY_DN14612_c0_g1_i1.p1 TRINITY_DN14612_c0_g1~~TRINITY_DN14612_c0_g1_i1.p1  ORF type:complete len:425 (+),score=74.99 TRINITY_DN14612_c0_g1_i1:131-1405(+)
MRQCRSFCGSFLKGVIREGAAASSPALKNQRRFAHGFMGGSRRPAKAGEASKVPEPELEHDLNRERLVWFITSLLGHHVTTEMRNNDIYEGVLHSCSLDGDFSITLKYARRLPSGSKKSGKVIETLVIPGKDFVNVSALHVPPADADNASSAGHDSASGDKERSLIGAAEGEDVCEDEDVRRLNALNLDPSVAVVETKVAETQRDHPRSPLNPQAATFTPSTPAGGEPSAGPQFRTFPPTEFSGNTVFDILDNCMERSRLEPLFASEPWTEAIGPSFRQAFQSTLVGNVTLSMPGGCVGAMPFPGGGGGVVGIGGQAPAVGGVGCYVAAAPGAASTMCGGMASLAGQPCASGPAQQVCLIQGGAPSAPGAQNMMQAFMLPGGPRGQQQQMYPQVFLHPQMMMMGAGGVPMQHGQAHALQHHGVW